MWRVDKSKQHELLPDITNNFIGNNLQNIEVNSLAQRSTLSNPNNITFFDSEGRRAMDRDIPMSFFVSIVFRYVMEVITPHNDGSLHFG